MKTGPLALRTHRDFFAIFLWDFRILSEEPRTNRRTGRSRWTCNKRVFHRRLAARGSREDAACTCFGLCMALQPLSLQQLCDVLQATSSADKETRKRAEDTLLQARCCGHRGGGGSPLRRSPAAARDALTRPCSTSM